jgi:hypothetical protein
MSRTLKTVGMIAGAVALVAGGIATFNPALVAAGVKVGTIATVATLASTAASIGSMALAKAPPVRGNVTQLIIAPDAPQPYLMGEGYYSGVLRHDAAYGATLNDVPNPYRGMVVEYTGGGPVQSITPYVDKAAVTAYYSTYLYTDTQLGGTPEASALTPNFAGLPGWDASSKLSGQAAILWNLKFDKKGKRFASGVPQIGAYGQWVKAYDPRLDDTFPGGSGAHRLDDEATWEWTESPALHFGTYAYGRHQNGIRTMGCGLTSIDWAVIAAWANVCEANDWTIFGVIYEPGNRWDNLKDIATAGGGVPVVSSGGLLSVKYWAPQVSLDTITAADIADGQVTYSPLQSWDERVNTIVPRFTSADNEWNQVAAEPVSIGAFVTEDGEEKRKEWPYNLVKQAGQSAQLAAYQIYEGREINPIVIPCLPRMRAYRPGECLTLDLPDYGLEMDAIILQRSLDPVSLTVTLTLIGETPTKHAAALGQTPAPPAIPVAGQDGEERDETTYDTGANPPRVVADEAALLALNVPEGTVVKRTDNGSTYFYNGGTSGTIADWTLLATTVLTDDLAAIEALTGTGVPARIADNTWALRTITGTTNEITVTNGGGVAGNPTLSLPSAVTLPGSLLVTTTLGVNGNTTLGNAVSDTTTVNGILSMVAAQNATSTFAVTNADTTNTSSRGQMTLQGGSVSGRWLAISGGGMFIGSTTATDFIIQRNTANIATFAAAAVNLASGIALQVNGTQVVTTRQTGWAAMTGTAARGAAAVHAAQTISAAPTQAEVQNIDNSLVIVAQRLKALIDNLTTHGLIGT